MKNNMSARGRSASGGKKLFILSILFILIISPVSAATNDFTADADITVSGVVGDVTADMLIFDTSTAESWTFDGGTFTVTNPGTFTVGSSDSSVVSIKITRGGTNRVCEENTTPGTSYATVPTGDYVYTIVPSTTTDCTSLCTAVDNAATLNAFPTCGALTCNSGYSISGSGTSATCVSSGSVAIFTPPPPPTTYQTYDPITGELITKDISAPEDDVTPDTTPDTSGNQEAPPTTSLSEATLEQMLTEAEIVDAADVEQILSHMNTSRDISAEKNYYNSIVNNITSDSDLTKTNINKITNFITYSTQSTKNLGAGERGGIVNSFKSAFGKLPSSVEDWNDVMKIGNGRWPRQTSASAEDRAKINFKIVYLREPDRSNPNDDAAITVMAYGLRPANRNLDSEKAAIKTFKVIYGYNPVKATAWDVVRAIAYSGATR